MLIFDIETDGLLDDVTKVHCICIQDTNTNRVWKYDPTQLDVALDVLQDADEIGGHNVMAYDLPALKKVFNFHYVGKVFDTLVASRLIWPNLKEKDLKKRTVENKLIGSHSLKAWGQRLGKFKGDYGEQEEAWETFSQGMLDYCAQDVSLNVELYKLIQSKKYPEEPMRLEHEMNRLLLQQQEVGFPFDVEKAQKLYTKQQIMLQKKLCKVLNQHSSLIQVEINLLLVQ